MNARRRYVIVGLIVLLCGSGALLWRRFLATAEAEVRQVAADAESVLRQPRSPAPEPAPPKETPAANEAPAVKPANRRSEAVEVVGTITAGQMKQWLADANDPNVMRRLNAQARNQTVKRYAALFTQLNLPTEQTEAFTKLLVDKRQANVDLIVASLQQGDDPTKDPARFGSQVTAAKAAIENQVRALLGDEAYAQYLSYDQDFTHATVLNNLQTALAVSEQLTPDQVARFTQVLEQTNAKHVTPEVITGAQDFLSPAQLQALQDQRAIFLANAQRRLQPGQPLPTTPEPPARKP